jgi:hypothetical protein
VDRVCIIIVAQNPRQIYHHSTLAAPVFIGLVAALQWRTCLKKTRRRSPVKLGQIMQTMPMMSAKPRKQKMTRMGK